MPGLSNLCITRPAAKLNGLSGNEGVNQTA